MADRPHVLDRGDASPALSPAWAGAERDLRLPPANVADPPRPIALAPSDRAVRDLLPEVVRHMPVGIGVVRPDRSVAYGNDEFVRIVGPPATTTLNPPLAPLRRLGGRRFAAGHDPIDEALRTATPVLRDEVAVRADDGRVTRTRMSLIPMVREPATVIGLVVYLEPAPTGPAESIETPTLQEAFVGVLSHELRTPITSIYGGTQLLLRQRVPPDEAISVLQDIAGEAERLHRLVEDLLALARTEPGMPAVGTAPVLLQRLAVDAARAEERRWPGRRVEVHADVDLPAVGADDGYVVQILRNLISNAIRYGAAVEPVQVTVARVGDSVVTSVLDRGPGVPAAAGPDAFRLFHGHPEVAAEVPGTGIGLFVARALVEAQGGTIWIRDRPGGGSEVSFSLPLYRD
jgi:signal transduction histidine kinase